MAFISLIFVYIVLAIVAVIGFTGLIMLIIGLLSLKNGKLYPKIFILSGIVILTPIIIMAGIFGTSYYKHQQAAKQNLFTCLVNNDIKSAQKLIAAGASPDRAAGANSGNEKAPDGGETLLMHFCQRSNPQNDYVDTVKYLIDSGAEIDRRSWEHSPDDKAHFGSSEYGYQHGDGCGRTALMYAAGSGSAEKIQLLIDAGADVNARDYCGKTALMYAASVYGDNGQKCIDLLLQNGADADIQDNYGQTVQDHRNYYNN